MYTIEIDPHKLNQLFASGIAQCSVPKIDFSLINKFDAYIFTAKIKVKEQLMAEQCCSFPILIIKYHEWFQLFKLLIYTSL